MKILSILSIFLLVLVPVAFAAGGTHNPSEIVAGNFPGVTYAFMQNMGVVGLFTVIGVASFQSAVIINGGDLTVSAGDVTVTNGDITASGEITSAGDIHTTGGTICDGDGNCLDTVSGGGGPDGDWIIATPFLHTPNTISGVGIGTNSPEDNLTVVGSGGFGSVIAEETVSANLLKSSRGEIDILTSQHIKAKEGLQLEVPVIYMNATNGDNCRVELVSDRVDPQASNTGDWNIVCYAPANVCGNGRLEPSNGEECDPTGYGSTTDLTYAPALSCDTEPGAIKINYYCTDSCNFDMSRTKCMCDTRCIYKDPFQIVTVVHECGASDPCAWGYT